MNTAAKGRRQEHRSIALYERDGFTCVRSAGSRGPWDFAAFSDHNVVLVQVRSGRWPSPKERITLAFFPAPVGVIRELHRWRRNARKPDVMAWIAGEWRVRPHDPDDDEWLRQVYETDPVLKARRPRARAG